MAEEQRQPTKLEEILGATKELKVVEQLGADLVGNDSNKRVAARKKIGELAVQYIPNFDPSSLISDAAYDLNIEASKAILGDIRIGKFKEHKTEVIEQILRDETLEHKLLQVTTPIKLGDEVQNANDHNEAYKIHQSFAKIAALGEAVKAKKMDGTEFYQAIQGDIKGLVNYVLDKSVDAKYFDKKTRELVIRAVSAIAASSDLTARAVAESIKIGNQAKFAEYFQGKEAYSIKDYARENLENAKDSVAVDDIYRLATTEVRKAA